MKKYVLLALLAATSAQAGISALPSTLHCVSDSERIPEITFSEISSKSGTFRYDMPGIDELEGSSSREISRPAKTTVFFISNGCDKVYEVRFSTRALVALAKGDRTSVTGTHSYYFPTDGDFPEDTGEEHITVTCTL